MMPPSYDLWKLAFLMTDFSVKASISKYGKFSTHSLMDYVDSSPLCGISFIFAYGSILKSTWIIPSPLESDLQFSRKPLFTLLRLTKCMPASAFYINYKLTKVRRGILAL